jgi:hypothetical protein
MMTLPPLWTWAMEALGSNLAESKWAKEAPEWAKEAPEWAKEAPEWAKEAPEWPKEAPEWPKEAPEWPKEAPEWPKEAPEWVKEAPEWAKEAPGSNRAESKREKEIPWIKRLMNRPRSVRQVLMITGPSSMMTRMVSNYRLIFYHKRYTQ